MSVSHYEKNESMNVCVFGVDLSRNYYRRVKAWL